MNLTVLSRPAARAEAHILSTVGEMMISAKDATPAISSVQDGVLGASLLSRKFASYTPTDAKLILADAKVHGADALSALETLNGAGRVPGRAIWSAVLRRTPLNYERSASLKNGALENWIRIRDDEAKVIIRSGRLVQGVIDKKAVGGSNGGLPALAVQAYGAAVALRLVDQVQRVAIGALDRSGISIGVGDLLVPTPRRDAIVDATLRVVRESQAVADQLRRGAVVPPIGQTIRAFYERLQAEALRNPDDVVANVVAGLATDSNCFLAMIFAASKGKVSNIVNVLGAIGQVMINGSRAREALGGRTFPYSGRFSLDSHDHGWIGESYTDGVSLMSFLFNAMSGRFDLTTKALTTAETGHIMRQSVLCLQSVVAGYCGTSGHISGRALAPLYGGDGMETRHLEPVTFRTVSVGDAELEEEFGYAAVPGAFRAAAGEDAAALAAAQWEGIVRDRDDFRRVFGAIAEADRGRPFKTQCLCPVDVASIVYGALVASSDAAGGPTAAPVDPESFAERLETVRAFIAELPYLHQNEGRRRAKARLPAYVVQACFLMQMILRAELAPPVLCRLSSDQLEYVLAEVGRRFRGGLVAPGLAIGILAAQTVGEPLTQYMLDSHHRSVDGGTSSAGLVRIKELMNATPVEKETAPEMTVIPSAAAVAAASGDQRAAAEHLAAQLEQLNLRRLSVRFDFLFESFADPQFPAYAADKTWIDEHLRLTPLSEVPSDVTRFCVRVALDPTALLIKGVTIEDLVFACSARYGDVAVFLHSAGMGGSSDPREAQTGDSPAVIRVWWRENAFVKRGGKRADPFAAAAALMDTFLDTPLRGVSGITNTRVDVRHRQWGVRPDGSFGDAPALAVVKTTGTNFLGVASGSARELVDTARLETTSIGDTLRTLGIEAARERIIAEFLSFIGDNAPDLRNLELYADVMTETGAFTPISKKGLTLREPGNTLAHMALASPKPTLTSAARRGATAPVESAAPAMMTGQLPRYGSLFFDVGIDETLARSLTTTGQAVLDALGECIGETC